MRYFDTTTGDTHNEQDMTQNIIGKRVMITQDGKGVSEPKDEQLQVEHGFGARTQKVTDEQLKAQVPQGDYTQTTPITLYTQSLENKAIMMSAGIGPNAFSKTSGLTQPVQNTKAATSYEGNVNFEAEKTQHKFRTSHMDLSSSNRALTRPEPDLENFNDLRNRIIALCK